MNQLFEKIKANYKSYLALFLVPLMFIGVALFAKIYVLSDHKNGSSFFKEVQRPGYETSPAYYVVNPSPAKAWELTHKTPGGRTLDVLADIFFWVAIIGLVLGALDLINIQVNKLTFLVFIALVFWASLKYGAYSSAVGNTTVIVSPQDYEKAKVGPEGLDGLFDSKKPL